MGKEVFHAMPLYPYFLGAVYKVATPGIFWAKLIQLTLGAATALFVYQIGKTLFDPLTGWIAALGQAFSGISIFYEELLVPCALVSFLYGATFFWVLRAKEHQKISNWIGVALLLGITTLAHAGILLFLPFLFIWMLRTVSFSVWKKCLLIGAILTCVLGALLAIFFRNLIIAQESIFLTDHGGVNFYIGNNPEATGRFNSPFSKGTSSEQLLEDSKRVAEQEVGRSLRRGEVSRFWFQKGISFIRKQPGRYLKLLFRKFLLFWNGYEIPDVEDYYFFRSRFPVLKYLGIPLGWILPFTLLGILLNLRYFRKLFLLYGFLISQMAALFLVFVNSRYRAPLVFIFSLFAAALISRWYTLFLERKYRSGALLFLILFPLAAFTRLSMGKTDQELHHYNIGIVLDHGGEHEAAIAEFQKALSASPQDSVLLFALANAYFRKGDLDTAKENYLAALRYHPHHADAAFNLGLIYFHEGHLEQAEEWFLKSDSLKEGQSDIHYLLSVVYRRKGLLEKSREAKARAIALGADPAMVEKEPAPVIVR